MQEQILSATIDALKSISQNRFYQTERGYQGKLYCALQDALDARGILEGGVLVELEYQKSARHGLYQRPDIIIHIPAELHRTPVREGNLAIYALKRRASQSVAQDDFDKLDEMIKTLHYKLGIFINIDSRHHHLNNYSGSYRNCIHAFAIQLIGGRVSIISASWFRDEIYEVCV